MRAASELNRLHDAAHGLPLDEHSLVGPFHDAQRALGSRGVIVAGTPKPTLLRLYFRNAAIAGMTDPFLLEVMLAPDLLDVERPFVLSHEWGHLAGYADESEANFIAWLACARGNELSQYQRVTCPLWPRGWRAAGRGTARRVRSARDRPAPGSCLDCRTLPSHISHRPCGCARNLRPLPESQPGDRRDRELRRRPSAHPRKLVRSELDTPLALMPGSGNRVRQARALHCARAYALERLSYRTTKRDRVDRRRRGKQAKSDAGSQIFGLHVEIATQEFHCPPAAPATFVAAVRLTIGQLLTQALQKATQARRVHPRRGTPRTLHADNLLGNAVMLPQLSS